MSSADSLGSKGKHGGLGPSAAAPAERFNYVEHWFTGGRSLKRVFRKKSLVEVPTQGLSVEELGLSGGFRQQVNTPVTMLGIALSVGASASLASVPGSAFAAEGSSILVLPESNGTLQESAPTFSPSPPMAQPLPITPSTMVIVCGKLRLVTKPM